MIASPIVHVEYSLDLLMHGSKDAKTWFINESNDGAICPQAYPTC